MGTFRYNSIIGHVAKEVVRGLVEDAGYNAYAYGYESLLAQIRYDVQKKKAPSTDSVMRLRSTPDMIILDPENGNTFFAEIKYRRTDNPNNVTLNSETLKLYQKYWHDSILIVVIPVEGVFYAQYVSKLDSSKFGRTIANFNLDIDFDRLINILPKIETWHLQKYFNLLDDIAILNIPQDEPDEYEDYFYQ